jgi:hypothetical protein
VRRYASSAASALLGAVFAAVAFGAAGGDELDRTTTVELGLILVSGALIALAVARGRPGRIGGWLVLGAFVLYAGLTAASVLWSIDPNLTWVEANRTITYLAVFGAALAVAHLAPEGWSVVLRGILLAAFAICAYALVSRAFPGSLADTEIFARLGAPYGYWNALGATAALAIPPALWLGARRSGHAPVNALAYPVLALDFVALFLSYSRGAMAAALIGIVLWLWYVPLRLRSITLLAVASAGAAPVIVWALSKDAFTKNRVPLDVRRSVASEFGVFVLATGLLLLAAGLAIGFRVARRPPRASSRLRVGLVAGIVACLVPVGLFAVLSMNDRGFKGTVTSSVEALTSPTSKTPGGPSRLTTASSSRARYWDEAGRSFSDHATAGTGAGTFGVARLRYRKDELVSGHAHGFVVQTMSDLGIAGLVAIGLLMVAWLWTALRAVGALRGRRQRTWDAERVGLVALALAALVYGLHSAIDWTWFVPGPTVMAVAAAGFAAGRSGLGARRREAATARTLAPTPRYALAAASILAALACAWAVWQPQRSDAETNHALDLLAQRRLPQAADAADRARRIDPLAPEPLLAAAAIADARGFKTAALAKLVRAVRRFPGEPQVWVRLAEYQLDTLAKPADALKTIRGALYLDPKSRAAQQVFLEARKRLNPVVPTPAITPTPTTPGTTPGKTPATPGGVRPTPGGGAPGPTPGRPIAPLSPGDPRG